VLALVELGDPFRDKVLLQLVYVADP
jgi:hypothetical protein